MSSNPNRNKGEDMKTFKIEDGIQPPDPRRKYNFPFLELKKNQSFVVSKQEASALRSAIQIWSKNNPEDDRYWTIRCIGGDEFRCWRIP